jgi:hypothetical protein
MFVVVAVCLSDCLGWVLRGREGKKGDTIAGGLGIDDDDGAHYSFLYFAFLIWVI